MRFSRKIDYGVILMEALRSSFGDGEFMSLAQIARTHQLPFAFLEKLADILRRNGYLESKRGAGGGYRLIRDPEAITLRELVFVFEESPLMRCLHSPHPEKQCPLVGVCPTRRTWRAVEERVMRELEKVTVAQL